MLLSHLGGGVKGKYAPLTPAFLYFGFRLYPLHATEYIASSRRNLTMYKS